MRRCPDKALLTTRKKFFSPRRFTCLVVLQFSYASVGFPVQRICVIWASFIGSFLFLFFFYFYLLTPLHCCLILPCAVLLSFFFFLASPCIPDVPFFFFRPFAPLIPFSFSFFFFFPILPAPIFFFFFSYFPLVCCCSYFVSVRGKVCVCVCVYVCVCVCLYGLAIISALCSETSLRVV